MIHVEGLDKRYGERVLFEDVSWHVKKRDRIGLSGPNGSGKTTLLRMLAGLQEPDSGQIRMASDTTIGYLPQDGIVHHGRTVYEEVVLAFEELLALKDEQHRIEDALAHATEDGEGHDRLLERYAEVTERFKHLGGWEIDARVADVLKGLGFSLADQQRQDRGVLRRLADADRPRQAAARAAEPAAHGRADQPPRPAGAQLARGVPRRLPGLGRARLPRPLLPRRDRQAHHRGRPQDAHRLPRQLLALRRSSTPRAWSACARRTAGRARRSRRPRSSSTASATRPPRRSRSRAGSSCSTRSSGSRSRRSARRSASSSRRRRARAGSSSRRRACARPTATNVVLRHLDLMVERGDRIALVGPNGAGKSTLMRILAGVDRPDEGVRLEGHNVVLDYFAQDQAAVLNPTRTVLEEMSSASSVTMGPMIRTILGGFLFEGDDVFKKVAVLSGGRAQPPRARQDAPQRLERAAARRAHEPPRPRLEGGPARRPRGLRRHARLRLPRPLLRGQAGHQGDRGGRRRGPALPGRLRGLPVLEEAARGGRHALAMPVAARSRDARTRTTAPPRWPRKRPRQAGPAAQLPTRRPRRRPRPSAPTPKAHGSRPGLAEARKAGPRPPRPRPRNPLAPRLRPTSAPPERQVLERELKRTKARLVELEKRVTEKEQAVKALEAQMAAPGFYDDRARAAQAAEDHQKLMWETGDLMAQWEALQAEVDEKSAAARRGRPPPPPAAAAPASVHSDAGPAAPRSGRGAPWPRRSRGGSGPRRRRSRGPRPWAGASGTPSARAAPARRPTRGRSPPPGPSSRRRRRSCPGRA